MKNILIILMLCCINSAFALPAKCNSLNNLTWHTEDGMEAHHNSGRFHCRYKANAHFDYQEQGKVLTATIQFTKTDGTSLCDPELNFQLSGTCGDGGLDDIALYDGHHTWFRGNWAQEERIGFHAKIEMSSQLNGLMTVYFIH